MKREELKRFAPMSKRSHELMMAAAQSVKEETVMKRKVSAAVAFAMVLILAAGVALAVVLSLQETGRKVLETEQTEGTYQYWPTGEKISLVESLAELGYVEKTPEVAQLLEGKLAQEEARRVADAALMAFTGKELSEINFMGIMEAVWGPFPSWSFEEKAWFSQLMADTGLQGADHTFYKTPEGPVDEAQAIAIARREIAGGYQIEESALDQYELSASFQVPEFLAAEGGTQPYWHIEYVTPLGSQEALPFTGISVFIHPDTGALLQSVQSILEERRAVEAYEKDPLLQIPRAFYEEYGDFYRMSHAARARFSREVVPVLLQLAEKYPEYYPPFTLAPTVFTYGVPDEGALPEKEARAIAERELSSAFGYQEEEVRLFAHRMRVYYDITDPQRPLWKVFSLRPSQYDMDKSYTDAVIAYYGRNDKNYPPVNYKFEMDAFTGEVLRAIPVNPVLDLFSLEEQLLMY